jgi:exopolyphosphatase/guanosine-5'-triphosphate,3'-diphosphate pyrophosphatase
VKSTVIDSKVVEVGKRHGFDLRHALRVSHVAVRLFDEVQPLHAMGGTERIWLRVAAMLHDVAKRRNPKTHHKIARDLILHATDLPFRPEERRIVGLVARYHRGLPPDDSHRYFRHLDAHSRLCVLRLSALLRIADGLDTRPAGRVEDLRCEIRLRSVLIRVTGRDILAVGKALKKADLFEEVFGRRVILHAEVLPHCLEFSLDSDPDPIYADAT